jgi:hypothetical protein
MPHRAGHGAGCSTRRRAPTTRRRCACGRPSRRSAPPLRPYGIMPSARSHRLRAALPHHPLHPLRITSASPLHHLCITSAPPSSALRLRHTSASTLRAHLRAEPPLPRPPARARARGSRRLTISTISAATGATRRPPQRALNTMTSTLRRVCRIHTTPNRVN